MSNTQLKFIFLLLCPLKWTNLQAVVSKGANPLPAEVRIKRHKDYGEDFFFVDQSKWEWVKFPFKTYDDKVQALVRRLIRRSLVVAFGIFNYVETSDKDFWVPISPLLHDACIWQLVKIVELEEKRCSDEIYADANVADVQERSKLHLNFKNTLDKITRGFIAKQILGTMLTVQVGKNWNSHGADLGSSLCQISSILSH